MDSRFYERLDVCGRKTTKAIVLFHFLFLLQGTASKVLHRAQITNNRPGQSTSMYTLLVFSLPLVLQSCLGINALHQIGLFDNSPETHRAHHTCMQRTLEAIPHM